VIEGFSYRDSAGTNHTGLAPGNGEFIFPAGSSSLEFHYAALTYTAPEKAKYAYRLEGADGNLVQAGKRRVAAFQILPPGRYRLRVIAANNDGLWNEQGATVAFAVQPFYWQTLWFRVLALGALASLVGSGVWRFARARYRHQITFLEQQRALAHERARLATVMEATTDLVAFADGRANLLHLNPAGRRMLGLENEAAHAGLTLSDLFAPSAAEQLTRECIPTAEQHGTWQGESVLMRRDGCEIPVSQVVMTHKDGKQVGFISIIARDISEQKRAAEEQEKLQTQLAQAQKMESVGRLAGGVAHEFNNMLQVIIGNADLALEEAPPTSSLREELVGIRRSAERSAALTRQLLAFARRQTVVPRIIDLNAAVAEMLKMLHRLLGENIKVVWTPAPGLWPVQIDPAQVDQILANLTINARDAISGKGTVSIQTQNCALEAGSEQIPPDCAPGDYVVMTITDDGRGMPPEVQEHLFEPFFTTKAFGQGTGLGLATVFGIVKQNSGSISVVSKPDHGTTFRIFLPRAQESAKAGEGQPEATKPQETGTVLLVEDEPQILELGRRALQKLGYTVLPASSPEMALELARHYTEPIDLLLTDLMMPGMNGKELRQQIQPTRPGMKCLFMSGYTADIISQQGALAPDEAFIQKPFTLKELAEKLRTVLHP